MKYILLGCYISLLLIACHYRQAGGSALAQNVTPTNVARKGSPGSGVTFSFDQSKYTVRQGASVQLNARIANHTTSSIYVANYFLSPSYYWQRDGVITASYLPIEYRRPERGAGYITLSPPVLYAQFREVKPGGEVEVNLKVPPKVSDYWRLNPDKWQVNLQHVWVSDIKGFATLSGQELLDALKKEGNIVWARADLFVE